MSGGQPLQGIDIGATGIELNGCSEFTSGILDSVSIEVHAAQGRMHARRTPRLSSAAACRRPLFEAPSHPPRVRHDTAPLGAVSSVEREAEPGECLDKIGLGVRDLTGRWHGRQREQETQERRCASPHDSTLKLPDYRRQSGCPRHSYNFPDSADLAAESI